ncbi:MAG: peptide-methionine (S)-S-oxide reductase MsrA [Gemmatimonadota bacterium]
MEQDGMETATLAGGCFWCLEAAFSELRGVRRIQSGYAGGTTGNPTYEQVCTGRTGHAEVVQVEFDPHVISYRDLLGVFFTIHDPTTPDRQGGDIGTQYRSAIYTHSRDQQAEAERTIAELEEQGIWQGIVTEVEPLGPFWPAEDYHRDYYSRNPAQAYCSAVIAPKVAKLRKQHMDKLRAS